MRNSSGLFSAAMLRKNMLLSCSETRGIRFARESPTAGQEPEAENRGRCDEDGEPRNESDTGLPIRNYARAVSAVGVSSGSAAAVRNNPWSISESWKRKNWAGRKRTDRREDIILNFLLQTRKSPIVSSGRRCRRCGFAGQALFSDALACRLLKGLERRKGHDLYHGAQQPGRDRRFRRNRLCDGRRRSEPGSGSSSFYRARGIADRMMELLLTAAEQKRNKDSVSGSQRIQPSGYRIVQKSRLFRHRQTGRLLCGDGENALIMRRE